jgi:hypothetical protein
MSQAQRYVLFFGLMFIGYLTHYFCKPDVPRVAAVIGGEILPGVLVVAAIMILLTGRTHKETAP